MPARPWDKTAKGKKKVRGGKGKDTAKILKGKKETPDPIPQEVEVVTDVKQAEKLPIPEILDVVGQLSLARKRLEKKLKPFRDRLLSHFRDNKITDPVDSKDGLFYGKFETRTTVDTSKKALTELYGEDVVRELEGELMAKGLVRKTESIVVREKNLEKE